MCVCVMVNRPLLRPAVHTDKKVLNKLPLEKLLCHELSFIIKKYVTSIKSVENPLRLKAFISGEIGAQIWFPGHQIFTARSQNLLAKC